MIERIYRDKRLPGVEIRNSGGAIYNIWIEGNISKQGYHVETGWTNTDCFTRYSKKDSDVNVSPNEAEEAAREHFDNMIEQMDE